jgi:fructokinase
VLKLNDEELPVVASLFTLPGNPEQQIKSLADGFNLNVVALTRGGNGSLLYRDGDWSDCSPAPVSVVDTVGAGDAFTAALVLGLLHGDALDAMHAFASEVAGYVCTCAGATPLLPERFTQRFRRAADGTW